MTLRHFSFTQTVQTARAYVLALTKIFVAILVVSDVHDSSKDVERS